MRIMRNKPGFTIIEILVAMSIFVIILITSASIFTNISKLQQVTSIESVIFEDLRAMQQILNNLISEGTIDYDEYYNVCVIQDGCDAPIGNIYYGLNHGVYGSRFFDPGKSLNEDITLNPEDLGAECSYPDDFIPGSPGDGCIVVYTLSTDFNVGQNPFTGDPSDANAFCDVNTGGCTNDPIIVDELYLIDKTGTRKTIVARKKANENAPDADDYVLGMVEMTGKDMDQNGFLDLFTCNEEYECYGEDLAEANLLKNEIEFLKILNNPPSGSYLIENNIRVPLKSDLEQAFFDDIINSQFIPITPLRTNIKDLKFIISPVEDPYKAYAEPEMQTHPTVTILMTIGLSKEAEEFYPDEFEDITYQMTVSAGAIQKIDSYPPVSDIRGKNFESWIKDILPAQCNVP